MQVTDWCGSAWRLVDDLLVALLGGDADDEESNPKVPRVREETY